MNRRSFIAALFAPLMARWMPQPEPDLAVCLDDFAARYLAPSLVRVANDLDHHVAEFARSGMKIGKQIVLREPLAWKLQRDYNSLLNHRIEIDNRQTTFHLVGR